jgi:photosynthetic reaction center cytochrome c subunit
MAIKRRVAALAATGGLLGFLLLVPAHNKRTLAQEAPGMAGPVAQTAQAPAVKTAAEVYKNIKVLKDIPAYELIPTMEFISASLGVRCEYCHVEHHFDQDTKRPKLRAREMMQMMFAIDKDNFHGHMEVTCNTCHNGSAHPAGIPAVAEAAVAARPAHPEGPEEHVNLASLLQPDAIVAKYVEAIGGAEALRKIKSRVITGTMTVFGHAMPIEIDAQAPDLWASVTTLPRGRIVTIYNGHEGWAAGAPRPPHVLEGGELDEARLEADFYFPLDLHQDFVSLRERPPQKINGHDAYVVLGFRPGMPPVQFYFDQQSGLLLRMVYLTQTAVGLLPEQTDYSDYREVDGVKLPFQWTVSRPGVQSTVQVAEIRQNVPISESKFTIPAPQAAAGQ